MPGVKDLNWTLNVIEDDNRINACAFPVVEKYTALYLVHSLFNFFENLNLRAEEY